MIWIYILQIYYHIPLNSHSSYYSIQNCYHCLYMIIYITKCIMSFTFVIVADDVLNYGYYYLLIELLLVLRILFLRKKKKLNIIDIIINDHSNLLFDLVILFCYYYFFRLSFLSPKIIYIYKSCPQASTIF